MCYEQCEISYHSDMNKCVNGLKGTDCSHSSNSLVHGW